MRRDIETTTDCSAKRSARRSKGVRTPLTEGSHIGGIDKGGGMRMQAYTVEQVAEMLSIGRDKVYFLLRTGQLKSIKIGKLRRITDQHLADFVSSLETIDQP